MADSGAESSTVVADENYSRSSISDDDESVSGEDTTYISVRVVFAVILTCGLVANCALIIYILRGQRRVGSSEPPQLNLFLLAVHCATNVINCLANIIWFVYTAACGRRCDIYTSLGCSFDAAAVQLIIFNHVLGVAIMSVDRMASVRHAGSATDPRGLSMYTATLLVILSWLGSVGLSLCLLVPNGVDIEGSSQRYLCTVDSEAAPAYVWTSTVIGYVCPIVITVAMFIGTAASASIHRRKLAASQAYASSNESSRFPDTNSGPIPAAGGYIQGLAATLSVEVNAARYVACLFVVWCIFILPFPILSLVRISRTAVLPLKQRPFSYSKEVDTIVTLLFVSFPVVLPVVTYIWRKDVCVRCVRRLRTCCRESVFAAEAGSSNLSSSVVSNRHHRGGEVHPFYVSPTRPETAGSSDRPVPVLFATRHGLHVRSSSAPNGLPDPAAADDRQERSSDDRTSEDDSRKCDVFGSVSALQNEELLNTSDYDSGDEDGGASYRLQRSVEDPSSPSSTSLQDNDHSTASKSTSWRPRPEKTSSVLCGIENQPSGSSMWYDDYQDTSVVDRVDRLIDSGVETMKKCDSKIEAASGKTGTTEVSSCCTVQDEQDSTSTEAVSANEQTGLPAETNVKLKKKQKNDDGRSSRRAGDAETSDCVRKNVVSERPKTSKVTSKTAESRSRRTERSSAQPQRRQLPKIVIDGRADEESESLRVDNEHANTDPSIATAMATLDVQDEGPARSTQTGGRPLPPINNRRRTASEGSSTTTASTIR